MKKTSLFALLGLAAICPLFVGCGDAEAVTNQPTEEQIQEEADALEASYEGYGDSQKGR